MAKRIFPNAGASYLSLAVLIGDTTITLQDATSFPTPAAGEQYTIRLANEYMLVTGKASNVLTVTRAQQGTAAAAVALGNIVITCLTDGDLRSIGRQSLNGTNVANRRELNFVPANGIVVGLTDDSTNDKVDVAISFVLLLFAGVPTGTPATGTPAYDTTNNNFYVYNGTWKKGPTPFA